MIKCYAIENHPNDSRVTIDPGGITQTLSSRMGTGGNNTPFVLITSTNPDTQSGNRTQPPVSEQKAEAVDAEVKDLFVANSSGDASDYKGCGLRHGREREFVMTKAYMAGNGQLDQVQLDTISRTLDCMHDQKIVILEGDNMEQEAERKYVLRRLTPTECARLQGFPDWWVDGANGSDSAQYKLWGNGIALPCAVMILGNIVKDAMK